MDKDQIKRLLDKASIPEPSKGRRDQAFKASLEEFEKNVKKTQGIFFLNRLMSKLTFIRRQIMEKRFVVPGTLAATGTLLIAMLAITVIFKEPKFAKIVTSDLRLEAPLADKIAEVQLEEDISDLVTSSGESESVPLQSIPSPSKTDVKKRSSVDSPSQKRQLPPSEPPANFRRLDQGKRPFHKAITEKESISPPIQIAEVKRAKQKFSSGALSGALGSNAIRGFSNFTSVAKRSNEYVGRDKFQAITDNSVKIVSESPVSTFSIDVDTASYSFIRREINNGRLPQKNAVRVEEMINYFDYDYSLPDDPSTPFKPNVTVWPTPWNANSKLVHIGIKGRDIVSTQKPRSNLVFLLDVSGSMNQRDKLPLLKNSFRLLLDSLSPTDNVAIVVYAGAAGTVLPPTPVSKKGEILAALDRLSAGGSTAGGEGIRQAYALAEAGFDKDGVNRVILATDGDFNVGIRDTEELKSFIQRKRKTGIFLSVLGFGQGNYNDALMQALAQNGNGNAFYIDTLNEARKVLVDEASSTLFTIAKDVKIQVEFNPALVAEYRLVGYETRLLNREDFNNDKVDAGEVGSGHRVTALYEIVSTSSKGKRIDNLRYGKKSGETSPTTTTKSVEYGYLKIRYKLPGSDKSTLMTRPITFEDEVQSVSEVSGEVRFAGAVAAFGQKLRGGKYLGSFDFDEIISLAEPARGRDVFGYRNEFVNLVRLAKSARGMEATQ